MTVDESLLDAGRALLPDAVELRRDIHAHPELGLELPRTQQAVLDRIAGLDLDVRHAWTTSSVVAELAGHPDGPTVPLRADMDALPLPEDNDLPYRSVVPDTMHACGHDAHTAMLVGTAHLLADRRDELGGTVRFMFQPGEEGHAGARFMIDEGVTDGVDQAFAIHGTPNLPSGLVASRPGPMLASTDEFRIVVRGRGGHASTPHFANDPIPVACEIVTAMQTWVTRRIDVFKPVVITVTKVRSGTTTNVIPETAIITGTIRSVAAESRAAAVAGVGQVADGIAAAHGLAAEIEMTEGYPVTVNDAGRAAGVLATAAKLLGPKGAIEMPSPVMGGEDFSFVLQAVPGAMAFLGMCPEGADWRTAAPNHSNLMLIDESAMATGIAMYAAVALDAMAPA